MLKRACVQVSGVLATMHRLGFAHLDVKPGNILQSRQDERVFKLGDFGLATRTDGCLEVEDGDRLYLAPELLAGDHSDLCATDVFSLGIALFELVTGIALEHDGEQYTVLRSGQALKLPATISAAFGSVLQVRLTEFPLQNSFAPPMSRLLSPRRL